MEAVPRLPMLAFERKTSSARTDFHSKLKSYIRDHYNEDPDSYTNQLNQLDGLRNSACRAPRDVSGCAVLKRYFCQLHFISKRFPMENGQDAAVSFSWDSIFERSSVEKECILYEMGCVLYNIGALHTQLGAEDDRISSDGMKMACTHFQCAAWAFQQIRERKLNEFIPDLPDSYLCFLNAVCLGQAQECILEKSMLDSRKATIIAKVAARTVDYYKEAWKLLSSQDLKKVHLPSKSCDKWMQYFKFKVAYYHCISLLYQGQQAEEQRKMGERVAYCQAAFEKLEDARGLVKNLHKVELFKEALTFTADVIEAKRKAAKNENEFIYHETVPDLGTLPEIKGASLVKGIPFDINDHDVSGPDIFARLVPITAHEHSSIYTEELAKILRKTSSAVAARDEELNAFLSTLRPEHLKYSVGDEKRLKEELVDRQAAMSAKQGIIKSLVDGMNTLADAVTEVETMLKEIQEMVKREKESEKEYQGVVGVRPPSIVATDLTREAEKYMEAHLKASESNETLHKAIKAHIKNLMLLMLKQSELETHFPQNPVQPWDAFKEMENLLAKVNEMRVQRAHFMVQLREAINNDDITQKVVTLTEIDKEQLFQDELKKHQPQVNLVHMNLSAQDKIVDALKEAYSRNSAILTAFYEHHHRKEQFILNLIASYDAVDDLIEKSSKGIEFYSRLSQNVSKLLTRVRGTCKVQEEEREQILAKNAPPAPPPPLKEPSIKLKDYLMKKDVNSTPLAVRPAPLGSEETELPSNPPDAYVKPEVYHPYSDYPPPPQTSNYYPPEYYNYGYHDPRMTSYQESYPDPSYIPNIPASSESSKSPSISSQSSLTTAYGAPYVNENTEAWNYYPYQIYTNYPSAATYTSSTPNVEYTTTGSEAYTVPTGPITDPNAMAAYYNNQYLQYNPYIQAGTEQPSTITTMNNQTITSPVVNKSLSNIDLLAGLDFDVKDEPLVPKVLVKETGKEEKILVKEKPEAIVKTENKPTVEEKEIKEEVVKDVLGNEETLLGFKAEVGRFEKFVGGLMGKTLSGPSLLDNEWKRIVDKQVEDSANKRISVARCYPMKNRFPDILPYDENRVELPSTKDDYINASLVASLRSGLPSVILTQSPVPVTYADFWAMILEQQIEVIVCLLNDSELAGHIYWPVEKSVETVFGKFKLSLQTCIEKNYFVERVISVCDKESKVSRIVVHLQFLEWPGSSFPASPAPFLSFVQDSLQFFKQQRSKSHPVVVHCLSGVGRSGLFWLIACALSDIHSTGNIPDIKTIAYALNNYRRSALRDREHLKFAYQAILYYCQQYLVKRGVVVPVHEEIKSLDSSLATDVHKMSITDVLDPANFSLIPEKVGKTKAKFTPESFVGNHSAVTSASKEDDPFSSLDPLWTLKK